MLNNPFLKDYNSVRKKYKILLDSKSFFYMLSKISLKERAISSFAIVSTILSISIIFEGLWSGGINQLVVGVGTVCGVILYHVVSHIVLKNKIKKKKVQLINEMQEKIPEIAKTLRDYYLSKEAVCVLFDETAQLILRDRFYEAALDLMSKNNDEVFQGLSFALSDSGNSVQYWLVQLKEVAEIEYKRGCQKIALEVELNERKFRLNKL